MPFTNQQFFDVLGRYNLAVWPAPALLLAVALVAIAFVMGGHATHRLVSAVLASFWAWMAIAYHFVFFTAINPAAWVFGLAFLVASLLFARATVTGALQFEAPKGIGGSAAGVLISYALLGYPLAG